MNKYIIMAIVLGSVACVLLFRDRRVAAYRSCDATMKGIDGAVTVWAQEYNKANGTPVTWNDLVGTNLIIEKIPKCPHGGTYSITRIGELPTCSIPKDNAYFRGERK